jgi:hypothetical protein
VTKKTEVSWDVTSYILEYLHWRFGGMHCLYLHGRNVSRAWKKLSTSFRISTRWLYALVISCVLHARESLPPYLSALISGLWFKIIKLYRSNFLPPPNKESHIHTYTHTQQQEYKQILKQALDYEVSWFSKVFSNFLNIYWEETNRKTERSCENTEYPI